MARAATTKLEPGQHSIDRAHPFEYRDGWALKWSIRLENGRLIRKLTQAQTKGKVRARAKVTAAELLAAPGGGRWKGTSDTLAYMDAVTLPMIEGERLAGSTTRRYKLAYELLRGSCNVEKCKHSHSLKGLSLRDAMRPRALTDCLEEIAKLHGAVNAKHAKTVAKKYLATPLKVDEVIEHNPLTDLDVDLSKAKKPRYSRGGRALTLPEYQRVIAWLLDADPDDVEKPKRGRWSRETRIIERKACLDIILAQATTGLRTSELCLRPTSDCGLDDDGTFIVSLSPEVTKTRAGRVVPVLAPEISTRLAERLNTGSPWLFPSPSDSSKLWDPRNRDRKLALVYKEIAEQCDVEMFQEERGHSWRTTNNTLLYDVLPEATRTRLFGHTAAVNRQHYTAVTSTEAVVSAAAVLRQK
ncbi:hypothetical protein MM440_14740 [Arsenicicoccus piscis]|uniref:Tyr recombinase domain-containing protein n=1 Tax=Arsenicicoccus piscis TaxID=673954 RepID=A0ABQ6HPJ6_9MICO|nr:hypothetical protein [Arsenicicoccus piscis]MCH8628989.1 hypothetical protein [Arsenicicoccus piscis]GMA19604.1 hypothetical protein GCM10025862_16250 [Arsenicicoccus piscis]